MKKFLLTKGNAMRSRCLLHRNQLDAFKHWLVDQGFIFDKPKDSFEVLRFRTKKGDLVIIHRRLTGDHFTTWGKGVHIVRQFIKEKRMKYYKCWCGWEGKGTVCPKHHSHQGPTPSEGCGSSHPEKEKEKHHENHSA